MEGHVKLELFTKDGTLVDKREDTNMMTNFLNDFLLPIAATRQCAMGSTSITAIGTGWLHVLFGTLQLFKETLSEDANDFMPNGQTIVGLSRYSLGYNSTNPLYGSFNTLESGWNSDNTEYTYVYDFPTSQANGAIASLGLSPIYAAGAGFCGVETMDDTCNYQRNGSTLFSSQISNGNGTGNSFATATVEYYLYFDYEKNFCVSVPNAVFRTTSADNYIGKTSEIALNLRMVPLSQLQLGYNLGIGSTHTQPLIETKKITLKNSLNNASANYGFINYYEGKIYACYTTATNWASNTSLIITCLDTDTWEESYITVTNTTGKNVQMINCTSNAFNSTAYVSKAAFCDGEHLVVRCSDSTMYVINLSDNNDVRQVVWDSGSAFKSLNQEGYVNAWLGINNTVYYTGNTTSSPVYSTTPIYSIHLPTAKAKILANNANGNAVNIFPQGGYFNFYPVKNHPSIVMGVDNVYTTPQTFKHCALPGLVLSTKMNLKEPVIKTADLTMKVTYKLKFSN